MRETTSAARSSRLRKGSQTGHALWGEAAHHFGSGCAEDAAIRRERAANCIFSCLFENPHRELVVVTDIVEQLLNGYFLT
jgi:hypothetical protein